MIPCRPPQLTSIQLEAGDRFCRTLSFACRVSINKDASGKHEVEILTSNTGAAGSNDQLQEVVCSVLLRLVDHIQDFPAVMLTIANHKEKAYVDTVDPFIAAEGPMVGPDGRWKLLPAWKSSRSRDAIRMKTELPCETTVVLTPPPMPSRTPVANSREVPATPTKSAKGKSHSVPPEAPEGPHIKPEAFASTHKASAARSPSPPAPSSVRKAYMARPPSLTVSLASSSSLASRLASMAESDEEADPETWQAKLKSRGFQSQEVDGIIALALRGYLNI